MHQRPECFEKYVTEFFFYYTCPTQTVCFVVYSQVLSFCSHYCAIQKQASLCSGSQRLLQLVRFFAVINHNLMATTTGPWKTDVKKVIQNPPITAGRRDHLAQLKQTAVSWEVLHLDDWGQRKRQKLLTGLSSGRMLLKSAIIIFEPQQPCTTTVHAGR